LLRDIFVWLTTPALVKAARSGNLTKVQLLLNTNCNVNVRDRYGRTALMEACRAGHLDVIRLLLEHGADPNQESFSRTNALQYAKSASVQSAAISCQDEV
jgi:uncharacterized protein